MMFAHTVAIQSCFNLKYLTIINNNKISFEEKEIKKSSLLTMRYVGKYISLQEKNGKYLSSNAYNTLELIDKIKPGENELFEIQWVDNNCFSLKANNGFYLSVLKDKNIGINQKIVSINELFIMTVTKEETILEFLGFC